MKPILMTAHRSPGNNRESRVSLANLRQRRLSLCALQLNPRSYLTPGRFTLGFHCGLVLYVLIWVFGTEVDDLEFF